MRPTRIALVCCLAPLPLRAELLGIELVGLGREGPSSSYAAGATTTVRFRLLDRDPTGEPVNVVIRRDDGFLTVVAGVTERDQVRSVEVPLKPASWTVNEFSAYAFDPGSGRILEAVGTRTIIGTGSTPTSPSLAATLEATRTRLREETMQTALAALDSQETPVDDEATEDPAAPYEAEAEPLRPEVPGPTIPLVRPAPAGVLAVAHLDALLGNAM